MSLIFFDHNATMKIEQVREDDLIRIFVSQPNGLDDDTIIFDLKRDDLIILMRHFDAFVNTGELMRV